MARSLVASLLALALPAAFVGAQAAPQPQPEPGPKVGEMAPDFALAGAGMQGLRAKPITLAEFRGQTVVVAFFPKARTNGCTAQMTHYRDQWATLFNGGKGVQVIAISMDADTTQANWAKEANLPMMFASDPRARWAPSTGLGPRVARPKHDSSMSWGPTAASRSRPSRSSSWSMTPTPNSAWR